MDSKGVSGTTFFIFVASYVIIILVTFIVVAVAVSEREDAKIKEAGGSRNLGFWERLLGAFDSENVDVFVNTNDPDPDDDGLIDSSTALNPTGDYDGDGVVNIDDIDIDNNGVFNSDELVFECGDVGHDGVIDENDVDTLVGYVFKGVPIPANVNVDLNADGFPDVIDVTILIDYVYRQGDQPTCTKPENRPPVIDSFEGPSILRTREDNWTVIASDPDGGSLNYLVGWGDNSTTNYSGTSGSSVLITHKYSTGGKYTIQVSVTDNGGLASVNSKVVEMLYPPAPVFCDFWSNTSTGVNVGDLLYARDEKGALVGVANPITVDGSFLMHTYGDDPTTSGIDEGAVTGSVIKFYTETSECFLTNGSNIWVNWGNKKVTLSCTSSESFKSAASFACGDVNQDGSIDKTDIDVLTGYVFGGVEIPQGVVVDLNGDGFPDIVDVVLLTNHVIRGADAPTC